MRKQFFKRISILSALFIVTSCSLFNNEKETEDSSLKQNEEQTTNENNNETKETNQKLTAWMPRLENTVYSYEGINNEFAELIVTPQFNKDDIYQSVTNNGGTTVAEIFEYRENEVVRIFSRPETYFRDNFIEIGLNEEFQTEEVVLKKPITEGTSWKNQESDQKVEYEITAIDKETKVPAGTFSAIEVTATYDEDNMVIKRYYAEDIGLIHEITESEEMTVESKLEKVEEDTAEELNLNVFIPDEQAEGLERLKTSIHLNTNDAARLEIQDLLSGKISEYEKANILPDGTEINYLFLNKDEVVEIDVSKEFVTNMNAGSTGEIFTVYGLVNTLSEYYGSQEILLTVDEEPYEGAHISLERGETFSFDEDIINE